MNIAIETLRKEFCVSDKGEALEKIRSGLDEDWGMDDAAELVKYILDDVNKQLKEAGEDWDMLKKILWTAREAYILGSLKMAYVMMNVNEMTLEKLSEGIQE